MGACRRIKSIKVASIIKCDIDICIKPGNMKSTRQLVEERELPLPPPLTLLGLLVEVEDMTRYIVDYLNEQDIRQLFNTSMRLASMKKKFVYWKLNKDPSLRYQADSSIRLQIEALVNNPQGQISLNLGRCQTVTDVSALGNVHALNLSCCEAISDVSALGNVYALNLWGCRSISDVSTLGSVHSLNLGNCQAISDVSALGNVHTLNLSGW